MRRIIWGACAVVLVGGALLWWTRSIPPPRAADWRARAGVLAGDGLEGTVDGPAHGARFSEPFGLVADGRSTVHLSDSGDTPRIRVIEPDGLVRTLAGSTPGFLDGWGPAARFNAPSGLAWGHDGVLYVADTANNAIRAVTPLGDVRTLAGDGHPGHRDGPASQARFNGPLGVAVDARGHVFVADTYNDCIREIRLDGSVHTAAGTMRPGWLDGPAHEARFDTPSGVAFLADGTLLITDTGNDRLRALDRTGQVTTRQTGAISLSRPVGVAVDGDRTIFVTDEPGRVVALAADGSARVLVGGHTGYANGVGPDAAFRRPAGLALAGDRRLIVADSGNRLVRLLVDAVASDERPPPSPYIAPRFDAAAFARVPLLWPVSPFDGPHEIAGTHGERRGVEGAERFHTGVDVRVPEGTPVHAVRPGRVAGPIDSGAVDTLNEWLRIGEVSYVHLRAARDRGGRVTDLQRFAVTYDDTGAIERLRVKRGASFETGDVVGSVNPFNHVHLGVGWAGDDHNPLGLRLLRFVDTIAPTIAAGGIALLNEDGQPLTVRQRGRVLASGRVQVVVDAWDQADGNVPWRRLGLHAAGYQVLRDDGTPLPGFENPHITLRFDRLGSGPEAVRRVYAAGSGIPAYGSTRTRFLYIVTNRLVDGQVTADYWDTRTLPAGDYVLRIHAADLAGNVAAARRDLAVTVLGW